jgi:hypothetical protein
MLIALCGCGPDTSNTYAEQTVILNKPTPASFVISSPLEGALLRDGKPLSHARIIRRLRWNDNEEGITREYHTDESGFFSLPAHEETLSIGPLEQFVGKTNIDVEQDGILETFWFSAKTQGDLNSEYDILPEELICDISNADLGVNINFGTCMTKCRWSNMPKPFDPNEP